MAEKKPQTFANHTRLDPPFHFFLAPVFVLRADLRPGPFFPASYGTVIFAITFMPSC